MGRMVHETNGLHVVRIVRGTNSQWYEKSRHLSVYNHWIILKEMAYKEKFRWSHNLSRVVCPFII